MKTIIFDDYISFLNREDKDLNGVSKEFANDHPDYDRDRYNKGCWNCSDCSDCSRCYRCSDCSGCSGCSRCSGCSGCSDCSDCSRCSDCSLCYGCSGCSRCSGCSGCSGLKNASPVQAGETNNNNILANIPIIENIHQKVLEAVSKPNALDMSSWHTCDTTHCRAGWVVALAGKAGYELEALTSTPHAAMQIYHASNPKVPVSPVRFYEENAVALADIERCAKEESESNATPQ